MCGILAVYDWTVRPSSEAVERGLDAIHHRGPDATSIWRSADGKVVFGHKRLSLVDLTTGDQPVANETMTILAVVNGEFYDFEKTRSDLEARGHRFRSHSDSELLVHLYEEFGTNCVHHLRGEYAFVLWDTAEQTIFAGRDRFGIKPLFYAHRDGRLSLASEVKALHASGIRASWDEAAFLQTLTIGATLGAATLFEGVASLPPAHFLVARRDELRLEQYWDFGFPVEDEISAKFSDEDYAEQFRAVLRDAVRVRMRADVPIGCYLSGGLDSCSILSLMAAQSSSPVRAFTLGFNNPGYDETPVAEEMSRHVGADLTVIPATYAMLADSFADSVWHAERLFFNGHGVGKFLLSAAVRKAGYKGVLTGEGADEILAGYAHFRLDALRHSVAGDTSESERTITDSNTVSNLLMTNRYAAPVPSLLASIGYVPAFTEPWIVNCQQLSAVLPSFFDINREYGTWMKRLDIDGQMKGRHVVNQSMYVWNKTALPGYMLTVLGDRMEMAHSVEGRVPFLDHHLVEFTRSLPIKQKINGTTEKFVLREAMRSSLTKAVYERQKHPFTAPPMLLDTSSRLFEMLQDNLRGSSIARIPYLNRSELLETLDRVPHMEQAERLAWEVPLTGVLSSCLLAERFQL